MSTAITIDTLNRAREILSKLEELVVERDQILSKLHADFKPYVDLISKKIKARGKRNPVPLLERVRFVLKNDALTTDDLAEATGVTPSTMSTWVYKAGREHLEAVDCDGRRGWVLAKKAKKAK